MSTWSRYWPSQPGWGELSLTLSKLAQANDRKRKKRRDKYMPRYWTDKEPDESVASWVLRLALCYSLAKTRKEA